MSRRRRPRFLQRRLTAVISVCTARCGYLDLSGDPDVRYLYLSPQIVGLLAGSRGATRAWQCGD